MASLAPVGPFLSSKSCRRSSPLVLAGFLGFPSLIGTAPSLRSPPPPSMKANTPLWECEKNRWRRRERLALECGLIRWAHSRLQDSIDLIDRAAALTALLASLRSLAGRIALPCRSCSSGPSNSERWNDPRKISQNTTPNLQKCIAAILEEKTVIVRPVFFSRMDQLHLPPTSSGTVC